MTDPAAEAVARTTALGARQASLPILTREADIVIAATGRPGIIDFGMVRRGQVLLPLFNPDSEIEPGKAIAAGAAFAADGRSIDNALAFPGLF